MTKRIFHEKKKNIRAWRSKKEDLMHDSFTAPKKKKNTQEGTVCFCEKLGQMCAVRCRQRSTQSLVCRNFTSCLSTSCLAHGAVWGSSSLSLCPTLQSVVQQHLCSGTSPAEHCAERASLLHERLNSTVGLDLLLQGTHSHVGQSYLIVAC